MLEPPWTDGSTGTTVRSLAIRLKFKLSLMLADVTLASFNPLDDSDAEQTASQTDAVVEAIFSL